MDVSLSTRKHFLLFVLLGIAPIILSIVTLTQIQALSFPFPRSLPALNIAIPIFTIIALPLARRVHGINLGEGGNSTGIEHGSNENTGRARRRSLLVKLLPVLGYVSTLFAVVIIVLSFVYIVPSDMKSCGAERRWLHMFRTKDERGIRRIQDALQCCGFNSVHDRAWPFPSRNSDARACERIQGYTRPCVDVWLQQESLTGGLNVVAAFVNWLLVVTVIYNSGFGPGRNGSASTRLGSGANGRIQSTISEHSRLLLPQSEREAEEDEEREAENQEVRVRNEWGEHERPT